MGVAPLGPPEEDAAFPVVQMRVGNLGTQLKRLGKGPFRPLVAQWWSRVSQVESTQYREAFIDLDLKGRWTLRPHSGGSEAERALIEGPLAGPPIGGKGR